jgi:hypothetical protein
MILLQKCLKDSDDEVRERALFYINLLKEKQDKTFLSPDVVSLSTEDEDGTPERDDVRQFIFDSQNAIDIDALEAFVM